MTSHPNPRSHSHSHSLWPRLACDPLASTSQGLGSQAFTAMLSYVSSLILSTCINCNSHVRKNHYFCVHLPTSLFILINMEIIAWGAITQYRWPLTQQQFDFMIARKHCTFSKNPTFLFVFGSFKLQSHPHWWSLVAASGTVWETKCQVSRMR